MRPSLLPALWIAAAMAMVSEVSAQQAGPALLGRDAEGPAEAPAEPLRIEAVRIDVRVVGFFARTAVQMTFRNPHERALEGDLHFPLPEGATVSGYALDIQGVMVDGVAVEKHRARVVYERIARRRVDPGLVEWTEGSTFRTRVFPLLAGGTRTVRVEYVSELIGTKEGESLHVPLHFGGKVGRLELRAEVVGQAAPPQVVRGGPANFRFARWENRFVAEAAWTDAAEEDLVIALPRLPRETVAVERADDGTWYFAVHDLPEAPPQDPPGPPSRVVVLWDASASRGQATHEAELAILREYFRRWPQAAVEVELVLFRNAAEPPRRFTVQRGDASALTDALAAVAYDGGTQLAAISPAAGSPPPDCVLLFSDGCSNFGSDEPTNLGAPLYAFSADPRANHPLLHELAGRTGGRYFNLKRQSPAEAAGAVGRAAFSFLAYACEGGGVADVLPARPEPIRGRFTLVGRLAAERARLVLQYGLPGRVLCTREAELSRKGAAAGSLLATVWAQRKLEQLCARPQRNRDAILALGRRFNMVTPHTSLLVLDNVDQYIEHHIRPPASLPQLRAEYDRRVAKEEQDQDARRAERLKKVLGRWQQHGDWHAMDFSEGKYTLALTHDQVAEALKDLRDVIADRVDAINKVRAEQREAREAGDRDKFARLLVRDAELTEELARCRQTFENLLQAAHGASSRPAQEGPSFVLSQGKLVATSREGSALETYVVTYDIRDLLLPQERPQIRREMGFLAAGARGRVVEDGDAGGGDSFSDGSPAGEGDDDDFALHGSPVPRGRPARPTVSLSPWDPQTPYLKTLRAAAPQDQAATYLRLRAAHGTAPGFFLDCAAFFEQQKQEAFALRVLSNVAELTLDEPALLRVIGGRLAQTGQLELAAAAFEQVLQLRPEEPQSYRDLALVLARLGRLRRAVELLSQVVQGDWDARFAGIEYIALVELNRLIPRAKAAGVKDIPLDARLIGPIEADLRVVLTWDANATDIDLWVTEPGGEKVYYQHPRSWRGGSLSADFTAGYGPEQYMIRKAGKGKYRIRVHYYGEDATTPLGPVTVQVNVFTNFGRADEQVTTHILRLRQEDEVLDVGEVQFGGPPD